MGLNRYQKRGRGKLTIIGTRLFPRKFSAAGEVREQLKRAVCPRGDLPP
jgi:hypothetical protein